MNTMSRTATPANRIRATVAAALVAAAVCATLPAASHGPAQRTTVTASGFGWDATTPDAATPTPSATTDPSSGFGWE